MRYCEKCKVHVSTKTDTCPLCKTAFQSADEGEEGAETYPPYAPIESKPHTATKLFSLTVLLSIVGCIVYNLLTDLTHLWCITASACILYGWLASQFTFMTKVNFGLKLLAHAVALPCLLAVINIFSGGEQTITNISWAMSYVIPFLLIAFTLAITILVAATKMKWRDYTLCQLSICILGFIPMIFPLLDVVQPLWPSIVSAGYSFATLLVTFLFMDRRTKNELIKRFHL